MAAKYPITDVMDFFKLPRVFGNPHQEIIRTPGGVKTFFNNNKLVRPIFVSHNYYPKMTGENPKTPPFIHHSKIMNDLDCKEKPENAQLDAWKIEDFFSDYSIPVLNVFTGGKGFQPHIITKPQKYVFNKKLTFMYKKFHEWLDYKLDLRTSDPQVLGQPLRLCRLPGSPYVTSKGASNGRWATPLRKGELDESIDEIIRMSYTRPKIGKTNEYLKFKPEYKFHELFSLLDIDMEEDYIEEKKAVSEIKECKIELVSNDAFTLYVKKLLPRKCICNEMMSKCPAHQARADTIIRCRDDLKMTYNETRQFYIELQQHFHYIDSHNEEERERQIIDIYFKRPDYRQSSCRNLRYKAKICVGQECPRFKKVFGE